MDSFSVTALTSRCSSITNRSTSSVAELQALLSTSGLDALHALADSLTQISSVTSQLEKALGSAASISPNLQEILNNVLATGDTAIARLHKQLMRLDPENVYRIEEDYMSRHNRLLAVYTDVFDFLVEVLYL